MVETNIFTFDNSTKFLDCNTSYYKFAYILSCCNFNYMCPCDTEGYFYWCGYNMNDNCPNYLKSCYNGVCCCIPCCVGCCCDSCQRSILKVK